MFVVFCCCLARLTFALVAVDVLCLCFSMSMWFVLFATRLCFCSAYLDREYSSTNEKNTNNIQTKIQATCTREKQPTQRKCTATWISMFVFVVFFRLRCCVRSSVSCCLLFGVVFFVFVRCVGCFSLAIFAWVFIVFLRVFFVCGAVFVVQFHIFFVVRCCFFVLFFVLVVFRV